MDTPAEPKPLALARAIHALFESSAATVREQYAALSIVRELLDAGPPPMSNLDARNPYAVTAANPYGGRPPGP